MDFPYADRFSHYLKHDRLLADNTINDINHDVADLFNYLRHFNVLYQVNPDLDQLEETDIRAYFNMLQVERNIKNTTYNKVLTHLTTYFNFLFQNKLTTSLPTIGLKGLKRQTDDSLPLNWVDQLPLLLSDDSLSYYGRLVLLLTSHFYTVKEMLQPGFYQILDRESWLDFEQAFLAEFKNRQTDLQARQNSLDLFLKQRLNLANPTLTLPALHKYLKQDQAQLPFSFKPSQLYQNAVCYFLVSHQDLSDQQLATRLRLDLTSLNYYRQLNQRLNQN